jgi:hypothetical protein
MSIELFYLGDELVIYVFFSRNIYYFSSICHAHQEEAG